MSEGPITARSAPHPDQWSNRRIAELEAEVERVREAHREFVDGLTQALQRHGVPATPSWEAAIDWLAENGGHGG